MQKMWSAFCTLPGSALSALFFMFIFNQTCLARQTLTFAVNPSSATQQEVYHLLARNFEAENPDVKIIVRTRESSEHKRLINQFIETRKINADVFLCHAGQQLNSLAHSRLIAPLTQLWLDGDLVSVFSENSRKSVSFSDEIYAIPLNYYQWGIYYKKPIFARLGIKPPLSWDELLHTVHTLRENGVIPFSLSGKTQWTLAAWFDHINLRVNGLDFHGRLLRGEIPFTDARVALVFDRWKTLIEANAFNLEHLDLTWQQSLPYLYRDYVAMILMGNFFIAQVPKPVVDNLGFLPFPSINSDIPSFEEVPLDVVVINQASRRRDLAKRFLNYLADADTQTTLSNYVGKISANLLAANQDSYFIQEGKKHIDDAAGFSQFYDRDANGEFAAATLPLFEEFLRNPNQQTPILQRFEHFRQKYLVHPKK